MIHIVKIERAYHTALQLLECCDIAKARRIRDWAKELEALAQIAEEREAEMLAAEIKCRAMIRTGEIQ